MDPSVHNGGNKNYNMFEEQKEDMNDYSGYELAMRGSPRYKNNC